jgi:hypothetical protein
LAGPVEWHNQAEQSSSDDVIVRFEILEDIDNIERLSEHWSATAIIATIGLFLV